MAYKRPESVLVVVYTQDSSVLLLQRSDWPVFWQSVTGGMQTNETEPLVSAWRELKEETGLSTEHGQMQDCFESQEFDIYPRWLHRYAPGVTKNLEHVFCFKIPKPREITLSQEHQNYCWVTKEKALELIISTTNYEAIKRHVP
ncbi:MAG: dihydroneopterin triphosphate diphosphatase [Proteobacteria bacterium]|nr:dihydroneopterin triphosphate diphosphatase [Pseudomonadota bacterium]